MTEQAQPEMSAWGYLRLVLLGAVIGIPAAVLASVFLAFVHDLEHWLWHDLPHPSATSSPPWYLVIGLPVAGACVVAVARRFLPGDGGHARSTGSAASLTPALARAGHRARCDRHALLRRGARPGGAADRARRCRRHPGHPHLPARRAGERRARDRRLVLGHLGAVRRARSSAAC